MLRDVAPCFWPISKVGNTHGQGTVGAVVLLLSMTW